MHKHGALVVLAVFALSLGSVARPAYADAPAPEAVPAVPSTFLIHDAGWLTFRYPASAHDRVMSLAALADGVRGELSDAVGRPVLDHVEVRVARGTDELAALAPEGRPMAAGATRLVDERAHLAFLALGTAPASDAADLAGSFRWALARLATSEATDGRAVPRWFADGFAEGFADGRSFGRSATLVGASVRGGLLTLAEVESALTVDDEGHALARAEAGELVSALRDDERRARFAGTLDRVRHGAEFDRAFLDAFGEPPQAVWRAFLARARVRYGVVPASLAMALVVAAVFLARRVRRAPQRASTPSPEPPAPEPAVAPRRSPAAPPRPRKLPLERDGAGVPKVEHDGRWHTLH